jgi:vitamin B12 transporter
MFRVLLLLLLISYTNFAQQDTTRVLENVIIQSNRIQTGFDETAASVIIISVAEIKQSPSLSVPDLLHYYAGVDIRQRGANGVQADAGIRGSTFDQVLILINGIKISDAQTGHHSLNLPVDIENIERIEILKGPAARIFGQNAFAGAINIITKSPTQQYVKVMTQAGDFGLGGFRVSAALGNKNEKHYMSASRDFSDGYQYNTDYQINNFFYQSEIETSLGKLNVLGGYTGRAFGANGFYAGPQFTDQYEEIQTSLAAVTLQTQPIKGVSIIHRLYWRRNQDEYVFVRTNPNLYRNFHLNNTVGYEINSTIANRLGTTGLGLDINQLWLRSTNLGNRERTVATLFAEHRFESPNRKFNITPGLQLNYYSDFGTNLFPGIDAGYTVASHIQLFGNVGYTYRVPTYTDLYYSDPANLGNPDLLPEYALSYEAGIKLVNTKSLHVQASYFVRNGKRIIDWTKENSTDPWQPDNLIDVNMKGVDMNFTWKPTGVPVSINGGYTYIDSEKASEENFSRYALENLRNQVVAGFTLQYSKSVNHTINYRYSDRVNLDDYSVVDTRLVWEGKKLAAFADVTNIFDVTYKETNLVTMPGRWFKLGVSYQFVMK